MPWQPNNVAKMYQRRLIPPAFGALELENELQYHGLAMRVNSAYDACISCENFVKFGSVTPELTGLICERPKNWRILFNISGSTGPISAIVAPYESALHADDGFVAYFPIYQGTLPWKPNDVAIMKLN